MKVEFVPFQIARAPLPEERAERASRRECGFFIDRVSGDVWDGL